MSLIQAACEIMQDGTIDDISVAAVLSKSGITSGSLYYHFEDFDDLIETSLVEMFSSSVMASIQWFENHLSTSSDRHQFLEGFRFILSETQSRQSMPFRFMRARLLAFSEHRPRLMTRLAAKQDALTTALSNMILECQTRGWFNKDFSPRAAAAFVQAYTFGKLVDDISGRPIPTEEWTDIVMKFLYNVIADK